MHRFFIATGILVTALSSFAQAQEGISFAVGPGLTQYVGDVNERFGNNRAALNLEAWYPLTDSWQLKSGVSVYGLRSEDTNLERARSFRTTNVELYSTAMYYFSRGFFTPFAYAGVGVTTNGPRGESTVGNWNLRDVQPEATNVPGLLAILPFGVGLEYQINPVLSLVVDAAARFVLSDQLDAVTGDPIPTGELSTLALQYYESLPGAAAQQSEAGNILGGNNRPQDWYGIFSVKLKFTPTKGCINPFNYSRRVGPERIRRRYTPN